MYKYWKFYLLKKLVNDPIVASQIYHMLYNGGQPPKLEYRFDLPSVNTQAPKTISGIQNSISPKKKEMMEALTFLKSKTFKSKQDKESIEILQVALKNER